MPEQMNFEDEIRRLLRREPFQPFLVNLTGGEKIPVSDPLQMAIGDGNAVAILYPRAGGIFIRKNQIVSVEEPTV